MFKDNIVLDKNLNKIVRAIIQVSDIPDGESLVKSLLLNAIHNFSDNNDNSPALRKKPILKFAKKEIDDMPKTFKKEFRTEGCTAKIYKRKISKNAFTYDIRYRRNGYNVFVTNVNLEKAKSLFIEKLKTAEKTTVACPTKNGIPTTLNRFTEYYFEKFRKKKVAPLTYKSDKNRYLHYLKPYFGETKIKDISPADCQSLLDDIAKTGKSKTVSEIYSLMSIIFKAAILHGIIEKNPLNIVVTEKHERTHGTALTKNEEIILLQSFKNTRYEQSFAILLYCGLRPNELKTAKLDGKFIIAVNSKRKNGKIEYKKIPVSPMLKPFIKNGIKELIQDRYLRDRLKKVLPDHILYDLRTTFYTRLKECNVADNAIKEFVGHSLGALGNTYTDLSDEYLLKEGAKYVY